MSTEELRKAVDSAEPRGDDEWMMIHVDEWQTILAALRDLEAENARLERGNLVYAQDNANLMGREHVALKRAELAESRLVAANALLRRTRAKDYDAAEQIRLDADIDAHLQGAGDEA